MKKHIIRYASFALAILGMVSCSEEVETTSRYKDAQSTPMTFAVNYPGQSRATATSFESNDKIGLYVAESKAPLEIGGNLVNNEALTYDGSKWEAARTLYWDEGTYNAYAYYPYIQGVSSTTDQPFSVALDQSTPKTATAPGGYEASDLLFATSKDIQASNSPISLNFKHIMSKLKIRLIKGEDFEGDQPFSVALDQSTPKTATAPGGYEASDLLFATSKDIQASNSPISLNFKHIMSKLKIRLIKGEDFEGEMPTHAQVTIHSTVPTATIDLQAGVATRYVKGTQQSIIAHQESDYIYSAIIVPQRIENRRPLIEVVMKGVSYLYESRFQFKPGTEHLVNFIISDNPDQVKIEIGGEIQNWGK